MSFDSLVLHLTLPIKQLLSTVLLIFYILLFFWVLKKWKFFSNSGITTKSLWAIFSFKLVIGFVLTWIYTIHYPDRFDADIFKYFDDSEVMYNALYSNPIDFLKMLLGIGNDNEHFFNNYYVEMNNWSKAFDFNAFNDSRTMIRINALIRIFSMGNFHIHTLVFTILSMIGFTFIFKTFKSLFTNKKGALIIAVFLIPSVVFWSSGALKESILIFGMGALIYSLKRLMDEKFHIKYIPIFIISIILLFFIKFYVLVALTPCVIGYVIAVKFKIKRPIIIYSIVLAICGLAALNSEKISPRFDLLKTMVHKQKDFIRLAEVTDPGSQFELTKLEPSFMGILKVVPEAILNCFIRPLPSNGNNAIYLPAIFENIVILTLLLLSVFTFIKQKTLLSIELKNMLWFCITFTLLLFIIIGTTTPVSGALVRYKVPALPFLAIAILTFLDVDYLTTKIPFLKFLK